MLLAIDASTTCCGWAVFRLEGEYVTSGIQRLMGKVWDRVCDYDQWLRSMLRTNPGIDAIAYEIASGQHGNMRTNRLLGGLEALTRVAARDAGLDFVPVRTAQIRAVGAHKNNLAFAGMVRGRPFRWDSKAAKARCGDEADAIGCGLAAIRLLRRKELVGDDVS